MVVVVPWCRIFMVHHIITSIDVVVGVGGGVVVVVIVVVVG